jgi:hypothetical protein
MQRLTQVLVDAGVAGRVLRDRQFAVWLEGSAQRRYNLVNRALRAGELVRLARGVYVVHPDIAGSLPHAFVVAQNLRPGSFVSFESALAWHGCVPEAVRLQMSVVPGRRKAEYSVPLFGQFRFVPLALRSGWGLVGVRRVELSGGIALVADPLRALLDLVCYRKLEPDSLARFLEGLRLEPECLTDVHSADLSRLQAVYRRRMMRVIDEMDTLWSGHD